MKRSITGRTLTDEEVGARALGAFLTFYGAGMVGLGGGGESLSGLLEGLSVESGAGASVALDADRIAALATRFDRGASATLESELITSPSLVPTEPVVPTPPLVRPPATQAVPGGLSALVEAAEGQAGAQVTARPPTQADIAAMDRLDTGTALKRAAEFAKHPGTVYFHNIGDQGGTSAIMTSNELRGGEGTASFGGGTSVRAWFGEAPNVSRTSPTIEFTVPALRPDVRPYMGRPGAKWNVNELPIEIRRVYLPDGSVAVPESGGYYRVTTLNGTVSRMHVSEFPK